MPSHPSDRASAPRSALPLATALLLAAFVACADEAPEAPSPTPAPEAAAAPGEDPAKTGAGGEDGLKESPRVLRPIPDPGRWREFRTHRYDTDLTDEQRARIRRLEAIGYLDGSRDAPEATGVVLHDRDRAWPGLNFYTSGHAPEAVLMDMEGRPLHRWRFDFWDAWPDFPVEEDHPMTEFWRRAHLYDDGDVLAIHEGLGILKLDRDSNLLWARPNRAHHDLEVLPDGDIYVLTRVAHVVPEINETEPILEDFVTHLDADGNELGRFSLLEAFEGTRYASLIEDVKGRRGDVFHTNSLYRLEGYAADADPAFREGNLLTYMQAVGIVAVVDPGSGKVVWARTGGPRFRHDPKVLPSGNLLIFENHAWVRRSRIVEYESISEQVHWEFHGDEGEPFFSNTCGTVDRLPNGNTLITESDGGRAFEVDEDGEKVWIFHNPHRAGPDDRFVATLFELVRLPADFPTGWIEGRPAAAAPAIPERRP